MHRKKNSRNYVPKLVCKIAYFMQGLVVMSNFILNVSNTANFKYKKIDNNNIIIITIIIFVIIIMINNIIVIIKIIIIIISIQSIFNSTICGTARNEKTQEFLPSFDKEADYCACMSARARASPCVYVCVLR